MVYPKCKFFIFLALTNPRKEVSGGTPAEKYTDPHGPGIPRYEELRQNKGGRKTLMGAFLRARGRPGGTGKNLSPRLDFPNTRIL